MANENQDKPETQATFPFVVDHFQLTHADSPGKFEGELSVSEVLFTSDGGFDEEEGIPDGGGFYGLLRAPLTITADDLSDSGITLNAHDLVYIRDKAGVIFHERSDGFVSATYFEDKDAMEAAWREVVEDVSGFDEDDDDDDDDDTNPFALTDIDAADAFGM